MFTFGVLGTLGILANPYVVVAMICAPAVVELIAGMMSLSQAIYHKTKAMLTNDQAEHDKASEHFLDATTRFALVLPLAMICIVTFPLEVVRFFTRTIMSIAQLINDLKSAFTNASTSSKNFDPIPFEALENDDNEYDEEDTLGRVFTK